MSPAQQHGTPDAATTEPERFEVVFDGRPLPAIAGQSVGSVLTDAGIRSWRTTRTQLRPRGLFCGIGVCYECLITVDGEPNQRACLVPARPGMALSSTVLGNGPFDTAGETDD
ncbi:MULTISPECIES: (2Fe-2S)-binding protein [Prauserella salsuginis group]|uniref:(2Fe-2S)-binding protein n=1 Tax=Prauserella salsuginis TaxID=387889 RepID=A0ABW6G8K7_9PSEU|nr:MULTISPECIES: (2Fe-2S)-binding protein [Prauserella salsuginis group]MCR3722594.1 2Fe-2S iron-sulfur cluster binding domain-containing protein [Prauserella flava]MCR3737036.1 2Fe-2S iron-sulfur cluster binding domain-containing protein [Prauserella salsuginis]